MILLADIQHGTDNSGSLVGFLGIFALLCYGSWRLMQWFLKGPLSPDPWDEQVATEIAKDETPPLCCRCLTPHDSLAHFCPDCGSAVGPYTNWLPYPYLFSVGQILRTGTSDDYKRSPATIIGFFLLGLVEYPVVVAPLYW